MSGESKREGGVSQIKEKKVSGEGTSPGLWGHVGVLKDGASLGLPEPTERLEGQFSTPPDVTPAPQLVFLDGVQSLI